MSGIATSSPITVAGPVEGSDRILLLDVLRGIALFGVLLVNTFDFAGYDLAVTEEQFSRLPTAALDRIVLLFTHVFVLAKANTLFCFMFGVSFGLQLCRLEAQSGNGTRFLVKRLSGLLLLGIVHFWAVWNGEILHIYAIAGFALLAFRRCSTRTLIVLGFALAVLAVPISGLIHAFVDAPAVSLQVEDAELFGSRLALLTEHGYAGMLRVGHEIAWNDHLASGGLLVWIAYALGRFMIGYAASRHEILVSPERFRRAFAWVITCCLVPGLLGPFAWSVTQRLQTYGIIDESLAWRFVSQTAEQTGVMLTTAAYVAIIALAWCSERGRPLLSHFAPAGQMALTNYVAQSLANALVFYGFNAIGHVGAAGCLLWAILFFSAQVLISRVWLAHFRHGPLEWLWRHWTYGSGPARLDVGRAA